MLRLADFTSPIAQANLGFLLILVLFSYFWLRFSTDLTLRLFLPILKRLKPRKKIGLSGLFKLGLFFQTTLLLMSYALFLILIPGILDLFYGDLTAPTSLIGFSIILFFCLNWLVGLMRWDSAIETLSDADSTP